MSGQPRQGGIGEETGKEFRPHRTHNLDWRVTEQPHEVRSSLGSSLGEQFLHLVEDHKECCSAPPGCGQKKLVGDVNEAFPVKAFAHLHWSPHEADLARRRGQLAG